MISRKEIVAIILMLTALICILNAAVFGNILPTNTSYEQLALQWACIGTAYICLLYSLSTWMYHSNYSQPRREMRIVLIVILMLMIAANLTTFVVYMNALEMSELKNSTDTTELFSDFDVACKTITIVLSMITVVLLFIAAMIVAVTLLKKNKQTTKRRRSRSKEIR